MANDGHGSTHSGDKDHGVQALWAAVEAQEQRYAQRLDGIECMMREIQQAVAGLGIGGTRNHNHNRDRANEMARGRPIAGHIPASPRRAYVDSSSDEDLEAFIEEDNGGRRNQNRDEHNSHDFRVKIDLPCFNGHLHVESFIDWLLKVENFFDYMQIPEDQQAECANTLQKKEAKGYKASWDDDSDDSSDGGFVAPRYSVLIANMKSPMFRKIVDLSTTLSDDSNYVSTNEDCEKSDDDIRFYS
ncbi:hypothetical protein Vadar_008022 [Vaccinium darrowii]|uniref:Uncharacterized protein n=1 Tax=Vaccinium darrowii TaxID=229202 RepID=A0ACB7YK60_9ERIC|nr:hypothetical protein Vadar_008022 [Vaccinium darrowii]